jgi:hypothetical protein
VSVQAVAKRRGEVDLNPLRQAFRESGLSSYEVAQRMGCDPALTRVLLQGKPYYKTGRTGRRLGPYTRTGCGHDRAVAIVRALGRDPWEFDL